MPASTLFTFPHTIRRPPTTDRPSIWPARRDITCLVISPGETGVLPAYSEVHRGLSLSPGARRYLTIPERARQISPILWTPHIRITMLHRAVCSGALTTILT